MPSLSNVRVFHLSKQNTSIIQPWRAEILAALKKHYQHCQAEPSNAIIEAGNTDDLNSIDIKAVIEWFKKFKLA